MTRGIALPHPVPAPIPGLEMNLPSTPSGFREKVERLVRSAAQSLGLQFSPWDGPMTPPSADGAVNGFPVRLLGPVSEDFPRVEVWAGLSPSLDLGLHVAKRGGLSLIAESFRQQSDFELEYEVEADDHARAEALLVPDVQSWLREVHGWMNDEGHWLVLQGTTDAGFVALPKVERVTHWVQRAAETSALVRESAREVPPASALAGHARSWAALADRLHLEASRTPLLVEGKVDDIALSARAARTAADTYEITVHASFPASLGIDLSVQRAGMIDKLRTVFVRDIELGDKAFDSAHSIRAGQRDVARRVLGAEARALLTKLGGQGLEPVLEDAGVTFSRASGALAPEAWCGAIEDAIRLAARVWESFSRPPSQGPYR